MRGRRAGQAGEPAEGIKLATGPKRADVMAYSEKGGRCHDGIKPVGPVSLLADEGNDISHDHVHASCKYVMTYFCLSA